MRPNEGVALAYRRRLERLVDVMHASLVYWLKACYRANEPELAQDASPAMTLRDLMNRLAHRWQRRFDEAAPLLARSFADATLRCADNAFRAKLKDAGFAVEFRLSREANDAMQATIGENVGLIRSIAAQHLAEVQGLVMRSVQTGRDIGGLTKDLQARYGLTKRRAAFIAHDQNSKATATITRVRQEGLGITEAIWLHSHGGRHPRPSHLAADGKRYTISEGMYLDGAWTWPGREPNCRCVSRSIIQALDIQR
ncbi:phage minor head protein [Burkholderia cepacia]|uniref:phage head morphogenesis protein n=2 Tax=Burkholderia TaxID=32008 RepID=UPI0018C66B86|nr:phage minor head protein [Burkholderia cepacia]